MLKEILERIDNRKLTQQEWAAVKVINKYFEKGKQPFHWYTDIDGITISISRDFYPSGVQWRMDLVDGGSTSFNSIQCLIKDTKALEKAIKDYFNWVKKNSKEIQELIDNNDGDSNIKLLNLGNDKGSELRKKYCPKSDQY